jgi:hypothetical protein
MPPLTHAALVCMQEFLRLTQDSVELRKSLLPFLGCGCQQHRFFLLA